MARYPDQSPGRDVRNPPSGFPAFFDKRKRRVVTADPWSYLSEIAATRLDRENENAAIAFIHQAQEFYDAADNPKLGSKPLLYYYAFLNLIKAYLLIRRVPIPPKAGHGISDPKLNHRLRLRLEGQSVRISGRARNSSEIFPELLHCLGSESCCNRDFRVLKLLCQLPSIHRTFTEVTNSYSNILPVKEFELKHDQGEVWALMILDRRNTDVQSVLPGLKTRRAFKAFFAPVSGSSSEWRFESIAFPGNRRGLDTGISKLAKEVRCLGLSSILTGSGYRHYLVNLPPRDRMHSLAASCAAFFYLGSVTRYKPYDYEKILQGGYKRLINEFMATEPLQIVYGVASELARVDVVRPYALC